MTDTKTGVSAPQQRCGKPAMDFIPRQGLTFTCVLPLDHDGACRPGGHCFTHGDYVGEAGKPPTCPSCPQMGGWPSVAARASAPAEDRTPSDRKRRGGTEQASECPVCGAQARRITEDREATWGGARDGEVGITVTIPDERWECPTCEEEWYDRDQIDRHFSALMKGAIEQLRAENARLTAALDRVRDDTERLDTVEAWTNGDTTICPPGNHGGELINWLVTQNDEKRGTWEEYEAPTLREAIDAARTQPETSNG